MLKTQDSDFYASGLLVVSIETQQKIEHLKHESGVATSFLFISYIYIYIYIYIYNPKFCRYEKKQIVQFANSTNWHLWKKSVNITAILVVS